VKRKRTSTQGKPVLDQGAFQQLLAAVYVLQRHHDRLLEKEPRADCAALSDKAEYVRPIQQMDARMPERAAVRVLSLKQMISVAQPVVEPWAPQNDWVIPAETAHQLSILASKLEVLIQQQTRTDSEWAIPLRVAVAHEIPAEEEQAAAYHAEGEENAAFEQPPSEPAQLIPMVQRVVPSGLNILPHRILHKRIFQSNELFLRTATVVAVAVVLFMLLGASVHRLLPAPGGLALSSEAPPQQTPFHRTHATESLATKLLEPTVVADRLPASLENSGLPQRVVKSNFFHSTYGSETDFVAGDTAQVVSEVQNRIRADQRLQRTQVQVRASNGVITLWGDVGSEAERVAAAQDAARIRGVEALVNTLRVITNPQSPTGRLQKPLPSITPIVGNRATESSPAKAINSTTSRGTAAPSNTHPTDSKVVSVSSNSSPVPTSAIKTPLHEPEQITVPYGTMLAVRLTQTLSSDLNQPGDTFLASLAAPIVIGNKVIIPEGAGVKGKIVDARNAGRFSRRSALVIELTQLGDHGRTYELRSNQYSEQGASRNAYAAAAITGGTGVGAILGAIVGRGKGAAIGAVVGAAAGTGVQAVTKRAPVQLRAESTLSFRLETRLTLQRGQSVGPNSSQDSSSLDRPVLKRRLGDLPPETNPTPR
jgi:BON domain